MARIGRAYPAVPIIKETKGLIGASVVWGHVTGVVETNIRTFNSNWTGNGLVENTGDSEQLTLSSGQSMVSETIVTGVRSIELLQNHYAAGDTVTLEYRHGATPSECLAATWNTYSSPFSSLGYVQVRVTSTL